MSRYGLVLVATLLLLGCPPAEIEESRPDIIGTWEVVHETFAPGLDENATRPPLTAEQHRYSFLEDSTMQIYRPRVAGPASVIFAVYDFRGDTLVIRSEFDSGYYLPNISNDTLYLHPIDTGRPLTLVRRDEEPPAAIPQPVAPPDTEGDYSPPSDLPPEEMPR